MAKPKPAAPMIYVVPFRAEHFRQLKMTQHEAPYFAGISDADFKKMEGPHSVTFMLNGVPILIICAWQIWPNRAYVAYSLGQDASAAHFGEMLGCARAFLDGLPHRRLEMSVEVGFLPGHQLVRSLGFQLEAKCMRAFLTNGRDAALYSRIKEI
jgi:hypothetical protein